jgi:large subunit ribosomal protein L29
MAKKAQVKESSLDSMSMEELQAQLSEVQETRFRLEFRHATSPLKNPMEIRNARRQIARIKTALSEKTRKVS